MPRTSDGPQLAFCENVYASELSPHHIRRVGEEGLKLGGGAPDTTLCGRSLSKGWDLNVVVTAERAARDFVCRACSDAYFALLTSSEARND